VTDVGVVEPISSVFDLDLFDSNYGLPFAIIVSVGSNSFIDNQAENASL
jgi:hypothetical protein